jgi:uncharacterized protein (DUF302 family)
MKRLRAIGWIFVGMVSMGIIVWLAMPSMMLIKHKSLRSYEATLAALSETLAAKPDWRVLTVNDYQKSTAAFTRLEKVSSVNICNPRHASRILSPEENRRVTAFMPLSIGVYEDGAGQVYVTRLNIGLLGKMFGGTIAEVMGTAGGELEEVVASVVAQ